jgi:hypothetical protein
LKRSLLSYFSIRKLNKLYISFNCRICSLKKVMPLYSGHSLEEQFHSEVGHIFWQHVTLSETASTRTCSYNRNNPMSLIVACHYFIYEPLRGACPNYVAYMYPLIEAFFMGVSESIRTAGVPGMGDFRVPL